MLRRGKLWGCVMTMGLAFYGCSGDDGGGAGNNAGAPSQAGASGAPAGGAGGSQPATAGSPNRAGSSNGAVSGAPASFGGESSGAASTGGAAGESAGGSVSAVSGAAGESPAGGSPSAAGAAGSAAVPNDCSRDLDCGAGYHCSGTAAELCFPDPSWQCSRGDECQAASLTDLRACGKEHQCEPRGKYQDACGPDLPRCNDNYDCNPNTSTCDDPMDAWGGFDIYFCVFDFCDVGDFCRTIVGHSACAPISRDMTGWTCDEKSDCGPYFSCGAKGCAISSKVCSQDMDCAAKEFCSSHFGKRCFPQGGAGADCTANNECLPTAYCDGTTKKCAWYPGQGMPCQQTHCGPELACGPGFIGGHCELN